MTSEQSAVQQFYSGSTVLITGGSGFLGKVLIEKLLRACPQLRQIVLLMRAKNGTGSWERLDKLLDDDIFKKLTKEDRGKVTIVTGDCQLSDLGLNNYDRQLLVDNVNVVFHAAASIRFNEGLASAVAANVTGTKAMLDLAQDMENLKAFVHVSSAFSNCDRNHIEEKFYPPKYNPVKLMQLTEAVDEPYLSHLTPLMLNSVPNTYVYTKAAAEELVRSHSKGLPLSVFRPGIVISSRNEPVPGWTDNLQGPAGVIVAVVTGTLRTAHCDGSKVAEVVPVDMTVNALIAIAWRTHNRSVKVSPEVEPEVFNFVSSPELPIQWSLFVRHCLSNNVPSVHTVWVPWLWMITCKLLHRVLHVFLHLLPAFMMDTPAQSFGFPTRSMKTTRRIEKMTNVLEYFMMREWTFSHLNTKQLWLSLTPEDKQLFPFSFSEFDWDSYFKPYMIGLRQYLLKDDLSTLPRAVTKFKRLFWMNTALQICLLCAVVKVVWSLVDLTSSFSFLTPQSTTYV